MPVDFKKAAEKNAAAKAAAADNVDTTTGEVLENNSGLVVRNDSNTELAHSEENSDTTVVTLTSEIFANTMDALDALPTMNSGIELTAEYYKFTKVGEELRGIFAGMQRITPTKGATTAAANSRIGADGKIDAARILIKEAGADKPKMVIMADAVIVGTLSDVKPTTAVSITYKGDKAGKNGTYKQYAVEQLFAR